MRVMGVRELAGRMIHGDLPMGSYRLPQLRSVRFVGGRRKVKLIDVRPRTPHELAGNRAPRQTRSRRGMLRAVLAALRDASLAAGKAAGAAAASVA